MWEPTRLLYGEGRRPWGQRGLPLTTRHAPGVPPGYWRWHACTRRSDATREASAGGARDPQPTAREGQVGPCEVAERPVRAWRPGNAGGAKGPQFQVNVRRGRTARRLAMSLPPPPTVERLQTALHTKAKEAPGYRFYALYDK